MLADYLRFLRQSRLSAKPEVRQIATVSLQEATHKLTDEEILQAIDDLDWKLRNFLQESPSVWVVGCFLFD